jgi:general secretion pathway protein F
MASFSTAFSTVVLDPQGRIATRRVDAASLDQARHLAARDGCTVLECTPLDPGSASGSLVAAWLRRDAATLDTVAFSQDLATLMEAGVTVKEGVSALARRETSAQRRQTFNDLNDGIAQGLSLSAAMERSRAFPQLLVATVAASEQTGDLSTGLSRYARHQQSLRGVRDKVIGACVYPLLLLAVGAAVVLLLLGVVVPRFSRLVDGTGRELPLLSQWLMAWGQFADAHPAAPMVLLGSFALAVVLLVSQWRSDEARKRWLARIPGVAGVVREFQHLQMYRTTAILTSRGIPIHKALGFSTDLLGPADRQRLQAGLLQMQQGAAISTALAGCGLSDVIATSMLGVAERSGALPEMLDRIADFYERSLQRNIDIVSRLIEPLLMIVFGFVIGGIVVLMYLPIFDLASSVS